MKIAIYFLASAIIFSLGCGVENSYVEKAQSSTLEKAPIERTNEENAAPAPTPINQTKKSAAANADTAAPPKNLNSLKQWIGKYPLNPNDKKYADFFRLPEVKKILVDVLGTQGFRNLLEHFHGVDLIEEKSGFLVMLGTSKRNEAGAVNYALVALKPADGETHVIFVNDGKLTGYGNTDGETDLPPEIEDKISIYAN